MRSWWASIVAFTVIAACKTPDSPAPTDSPAAEPDAPDMPDLAALPPGHHLGAWPTYEGLPPALATQVDGKLAEARAAGMDIERIHIAWSELEPTAGTFQLDVLTEALVAASGHGALYVLIETIDSDGYSLPADLVDPADGYALASGRRFDDPVIVARFGALLDRVLPMLEGKQVFALGVGNEADAYFDDHAIDSPEGISWRDGLVGFLTAARDRVHAVMPDVGVAITLREGSVHQGYTAALAPIVAAGDVAVFNYYCQDVAFQVKPATTVAGELDALIAIAAGKPIVLQELGCPAGPSGSASVLGASEAAQAAFYRAVIDAMPARPTLRAAFAFQVVDWSPELSTAFSEAYREEGFPELADQVYETLSTLGLVHYSDGAPRAAWTVFVDGVTELSR